MHVLTAEAGALSFADAGILALLGYGMVFVGLILLMIVVMIIGKSFSAATNKKAAKEAAVKEQVAEEPASPVFAPGSAGGVKIYDVEPKTAAMLMAIVADKLGKPLNELRFISIKEVK